MESGVFSHCFRPRLHADVIARNQSTVNEGTVSENLYEYRVVPLKVHFHSLQLRIRWKPESVHRSSCGFHSVRVVRLNT